MEYSLILHADSLKKNFIRVIFFGFPQNQINITRKYMKNLN